MPFFWRMPSTMRSCCHCPWLSWRAQCGADTHFNALAFVLVRADTHTPACALTSCMRRHRRPQLHLPPTCSAWQICPHQGQHLPTACMGCLPCSRSSPTWTCQVSAPAQTQAAIGTQGWLTQGASRLHDAVPWPWFFCACVLIQTKGTGRSSIQLAHPLSSSPLCTLSSYHQPSCVYAH